MRGGLLGLLAQPGEAFLYDQPQPSAIPPGEAFLYEGRGLMDMLSQQPQWQYPSLSGSGQPRHRLLMSDDGSFNDRWRQPSIGLGQGMPGEFEARLAAMQQQQRLVAEEAMRRQRLQNAYGR